MFQVPGLQTRLNFLNPFLNEHLGPKEGLCTKFQCNLCSGLGETTLKLDKKTCF